MPKKRLFIQNLFSSLFRTQMKMRRLVSTDWRSRNRSACERRSSSAKSSAGRCRLVCAKKNWWNGSAARTQIRLLKFRSPHPTQSQKPNPHSRSLHWSLTEPPRTLQQVLVPLVQMWRPVCRTLNLWHRFQAGLGRRSNRSLVLMPASRANGNRSRRGPWPHKTLKDQVLLRPAR